MSLSRDLTFKQIRAFAAVMRTGSVTLAAAELFVTPPAISSQLKILRRLVGADIYTKQADGLRPTQIGTQLLALYESLDASIHTTAQKIEALKAGKAGYVGLAVVSTGKYFAPNIMHAFTQAYPGIVLNPVIGNRRDILKALQTGSVDLAIMGRPPANLEFISQELGDHPNILIAPPDHKLAGRSPVDPKELLRETMLLREPGSGTRRLARRFMEAAGEGMDYPTLTMGSNESIKQSVMAGLGIAMISQHTVLSELEFGRLVSLNLPGLPIVRKWILVHPSDTKLSGAAQQFHDFLLENRGDLIP